MLFSNLPPFSVLLLTFTALFAHSAAGLALHIPQSRDIIERAPEAIPDQWTNAQRLSAGLPPHAPRVVKRATPTEPGLVKRTHPSASPSPAAYTNRVTLEPKSYTGRIEVRTVPDAVSLGFVRLSTSGVALGNDDATDVAFTAPGSRTPFNIATIDTETALNFGALGTAKFASGSSSAAVLSSAELSSPHARPSTTGGESAIWSINAATLQLKPRWVNPDGSHPRTTAAYSSADSALFLTGDLSAYNAAHADAPAYEVAFFLVSQ